MKIKIESLVQSIDLELTKKILLCLSGVVLFCIPMDAFSLMALKPKLENIGKPMANLSTFPLEPLNEYLRVFDRNTLFGGVLSPGTVEAPQISTAELVKDYRLKGVVLMGDISEAVIEDAKTQRIVFVKKGDTVGNLIVKDIIEGFVILSCQSGEATLAIQ